MNPQEIDVASVPQRKPSRMSIELFRGFVEGRPDEEHWELIDGVAMMMAPPTLAHQQIATNLLLLLRAALHERAPGLTAIPAIGVNLAPEVRDYDPEPDVVVIDADAAERRGERYANRFYLVAEVVSSSDRVDIGRKREVYKLHDACKCILTVQQDCFEIRIDLRTETGWSDQTLRNADDVLALADFGLRCKVSEIYRGTPLLPQARAAT
jgi:Uma2 family endonuclease